MPQETSLLTATSCPSPAAGAEMVIPVDEVPGPVVRFPPCDVRGHGLIFGSSRGLEAVQDGRATILISRSVLQGVVGLAALSQDGSKLAYSQTEQDVWVADLLTGRARPLTRGAIRSEYADLLRFAWSPDGTWLALVVGDESSGGRGIEHETLFTVEAGTGRAHEIMTGMYDFHWTQTGELAFLGTKDDDYGLFLVQPDGTCLRRLYAPERWLQPSLASSPRDGTLLLVEGGATARAKLLAVNPRDGSALDLLRHYQGKPIDPYWPAWSADGQQVAFLSSGAGDLYVLDVASGDVQQHGSGLTGPLAWSPDGSLLAATDLHDWTICLISLQGSPAVRHLGIKAYSLNLFEWH